MIVVLLGYMASGKSSIGKLLAKKLSYDFIDLDNYIEEKEGLTVASIFDNQGEIFFRKQEALALIEILQNKTNLVLSLGGGTPCYAGNMDKILNTKNVKSFYLKASIPTIVDRLENEESKRPLISHLTNQEDLIEFIGKHLFERAQYYNLANHIVTTDDKPIETIVNTIGDLL